jgi:hypothetical protein
MPYAPEYYDDGAEDTPTEVDVTAGANDPQSMTVDGTSVTNRSVDDLTKADRHKAANAARSAPFAGMGMRRVNPGSALHE